MIRGAVSGAVSGGIGAGLGSLPTTVGFLNGTLAGGAFGAAAGLISGGLTSLAFGENVTDGAINGMANGAMMGAIFGGISGAQNARRLGLEDIITGGSLNERAQGWANFFGMKNLKASVFTSENIKQLNDPYINSEMKVEFSKYRFSKDGSGVIFTERSTGRTGNVDGYYRDTKGGAYFTKQTVRNMRFNDGWGKGTFFHEYSHLKGLDEVWAYRIGAFMGGQQYIDHCEIKPQNLLIWDMILNTH